MSEQCPVPLLHDKRGRILSGMYENRVSGPLEVAEMKTDMLGVVLAHRRPESTARRSKEARR